MISRLKIKKECIECNEGLQNSEQNIRKKNQ